MAFLGDFGAVISLLKKIYDTNPPLRDFLKNRYSGIFNVESYDDFRKLPILRKSEYSKIQQNNLPFGNLINVKPIKYFQSPGPINNVKILDFEHYRFYKGLKAVGFDESDIVVNSFGYSITPAGEMFDEACRYLNIPVFPLGPTDSKKAAEFVDTFSATAFIGTKSFLIKVADQTKKRSLKKAYLIAEKMTEDDRIYIKKEFGIDAYQGYGVAEVGMIATEVKGEKYMQVDTDAIFVEHIDPGGEEVAELNCYGELVLTFLNDKLPFIRFATGDIVSYENRFLKGVFGRVDSSVKVKGVFIHFWQFEDFCNELGARIRLIVDNMEKNDIILLQVDKNIDNLKEHFKSKFGLSVGGIEIIDSIEKIEVVDKRTNWGKE